jgi:hypothetical protein
MCCKATPILLLDSRTAEHIQFELFFHKLEGMPAPDQYQWVSSPSSPAKPIKIWPPSTHQRFLFNQLDGSNGVQRLAREQVDKTISLEGVHLWNPRDFHFVNAEDNVNAEDQYCTPGAFFSGTLDH